MENSSPTIPFEKKLKIVSIFSFDFIYPLFTSGKAGTNRTARIYARGIWTFQNKRDFLSI